VKYFTDCHCGVSGSPSNFSLNVRRMIKTPHCGHTTSPCSILKTKRPHHFGPHVRRGLEASRSQRHHLSFVTRFAIMTRGNQRDKAREKNLKEQAAAVRASFTLDVPICAHFAIPVEEAFGAPSTFFFVHPGQNLPMCRGTQS